METKLDYLDEQLDQFEALLRMVRIMIVREKKDGEKLKKRLELMAKCDHVIGYEPNEDSMTIRVRKSQVFNGIEGYYYRQSEDWCCKYCPDCGADLSDINQSP